MTDDADHFLVLGVSLLSAPSCRCHLRRRLFYVFLQQTDMLRLYSRPSASQPHRSRRAARRASGDQRFSFPISGRRRHYSRPLLSSSLTSCGLCMIGPRVATRFPASSSPVTVFTARSTPKQKPAVFASIISAKYISPAGKLFFDYFFIASTTPSIVRSDESSKVASSAHLRELFRGSYPFVALHYLGKNFIIIGTLAFFDEFFVAGGRHEPLPML